MKKGKLVLKNNIRKLILVLVLVLFVSLCTYVTINTFKKTKIDKVLETSSYSYLPKEAKNFIKEVYDETGEVVLTEKNKKSNTPYLNSQYVSYLALNDEEKKNVGYVPNIYTIDYIENDNYEAETLSPQFDLKDYLTPMRNQGGLGICWTISSVENVETYLMLKNKTPYNSNSKILSERQFDYATSTNGMYYKRGTGTSEYIWSNSSNGYRTLTSGGNFFMASVAMSNGITLTDESVLPFSESTSKKKPEEILNFNNSEYEVNETIQLPMINSDTATSSEINNYVAMVKNYIKEYGGLFIGTYSPQSTCGFKNTDGTYAMKTDDCANVNSDMGHAMQLVGWDDNYSYTYCDKGTTHSEYTASCSSSYKKTGKGAWILKNSWGVGHGYEYVYLTYDSTRLSIGFVTDISEMSKRTWDNNYHVNIVENESLYVTSDQTITLNKKINNKEKIEKIKFHTLTQGGSYTLKITSNDINYSETISVDEIGIYTFDLSNKNLFVDDKTLSFRITGNNGSVYLYSSGSLFTSNVSNDVDIMAVNGYETKSDDSSIPSEDNPIYIEGNYGNMALEFYTRNIPSNADISFRAINKNGEDYTNYLFYTNQLHKFVIDGYIYFDPGVRTGSSEYSDKPVCGEVFDLEILYNGDVIDTIPVKRICNDKTTKSVINFHANDGSGYVSSVSKNDLYDIQMMNADGTGREYIGSEKKFFHSDRHITAWNTRSDGTGTNYTSNTFLLYANKDLYAQWAYGHTYKVNYQCARYICDDALIVSRSYSKEYDQKFAITENSFTNLNGDRFLYWENDDVIYYPGEEVINLGSMESPYNDDDNVFLVAEWASDYKTVTFNSNGGIGTMSSINVKTNTDSRLKYNSFTKSGSEFKGWTTNSDGSGTRYGDGEVININKNITLYALWNNTKYNVRFDANGGTGSMDIQEFEHTISGVLNENKFSRVGYTFKGWNTKKDGSGASYTDKQSVLDLTKNVETITLYAQWEANTYTVIFNSNGGEGEMNSQIFKYDEEKALSANIYTKEGFIFGGWNTSSDFSGTDYSDKQVVKNLTTGTTVRLYAVWIERTYEIENYKVDDSTNMIEAISVNTTIDDFKENIKVGADYKVEVDSKEVEGKQILYTGGKTKIYRSNDLIAEYTNVVLGDVNGDAEINSADLFRIRQHLLTIIELKNEFALASDVNSDAEINSADLFRTRQHLLRIVNIG